MRWWLLRCLACSCWLALWANNTAFAGSKWTELNVGPFYVATDSDESAARYDLTQLEQTRWVLSGLLEIKELNAAWPFRVLITKAGQPGGEFALHNGYYLLVTRPGAALPLGQVSRLFLAANTPRIPAAAEQGIAELFDTLKANGPHVSWGGEPVHPDLAFARMQLFATKFDYSASFHILVNSLRNGSTLPVAERNAFGKDAQALEQEAAAQLSANNWQAVSISGRPLDPKRDFGEHSLDAGIADVYLASAAISADPDKAQGLLKQLLNEGGQAQTLALESLGDVAVAKNEKANEYWEDAMRAGSKSAQVYFDAASDQPPDLALPLLKKAAQLNPSWADPVFAEAEATQDPKQREALLKHAIQLNSRSSDYWVKLAQAQMENGEALAAQSSWARAENAAPDDAHREAVEKLHADMESARLDQEEAGRKQERAAAILDDQRAQQAEQERIHAAELRADQASAETNGGGSSSDVDVVDWNSLTKTQKTYGHVVTVDCRKNYVRVAVKDLRGKTRQLLFQDPQQKTFSCENKPEPRQVVITFRPHDDGVHGTDGDIVSVGWR